MLLLCSMIYYMAGQMNLDVSANPFAQAVTVVVLVLDLLIYYKADSLLTAGYLADDKDKEKEYLRQYERFQKYGNGILDSLGKRTAKKHLQEHIKACFPEWLMQLSLLMQSENVQVAIFKSYDNAPAILKPALKEMIGALRIDPNDKRAYMNFLSEFTLPEVRSTMKMLYSISEGKGGEARGQISEIIKRNQEMSDKAKRQHEVQVVEKQFVAISLGHMLGFDNLVSQTRTVRNKDFQLFFLLLHIFVQEFVVRIQTSLTLGLTSLWSHANPFKLAFESLATLAGCLFLLSHALGLLVKP